MAGILANSISVTMSSSATTSTGYITAEMITLTLDVTGTSYAWSVAKPIGSTIRARLSDTTSASVTIVPDVAGYYVATCLVNGTTYAIQLSVVDVSPVTFDGARRWVARTAASVPAPNHAGDQTEFLDSASGRLKIKDSTGTITDIATPLTTRDRNGAFPQRSTTEVFGALVTDQSGTGRTRQDFRRVLSSERPTLAQADADAAAANVPLVIDGAVTLTADMSFAADVVDLVSARGSLIYPGLTAAFKGTVLTDPARTCLDPTGTTLIPVRDVDAPDHLTIKFDQHYAGPLHFERASTAPVIVDGVASTAGVNVPRLTPDGLMIEPASQNFLASPHQLTAAAWTLQSMGTVTTGVSDPQGGTDAAIFAMAVDSSPTTHLIFQLGSPTADTTTLSWYVYVIPGNIVDSFRVGDNSGAHYAIFDCTGQGLVETEHGAGTHGEIEKWGVKTIAGTTYTIYRISVTCTPVTGMLTQCYPCHGGNVSYQDDGTGKFGLAHPQTEPLWYASSWMLVNRAAELALLPIPNLGGEWCVEIVATLCGPQRGRNGAGAVMGWVRPLPMGPVSHSGAVSLDLTFTGLPTPTTLNIWIKVSTQGLSDGTAQWEYSLDLGTTWSAPAAVPSGGGTAAIGLTGVTANFPNGSYYADNVWKSEQQHAPLCSHSVHKSSNSFEGYVTNGNAVASVFDPSATELKCTSTALAVGNWYMGPRRLAFASLGQLRPAVYLDGRQTVPTIAGTGTGIFLGSAPALLRLGATNDGMYGGVKIREIRFSLKSQIPATEPIGAFSYQWAMDRGGVASADCIVAAGDSNQQGIADFSLNPYPFLMVAAGQQVHNFGIGSNTSRQLLRRCRLDVFGRGYKKMMLQIGINDVNSLISGAESIANIRQILWEAICDRMSIAIGTLFPGGHAPGSYQLAQFTAINAFINSVPSLVAFSGGRTAIADFYTALLDPLRPGHMNPTFDLDGGELHVNQLGHNLLGPIAKTALDSLVIVP